VGPEQVWTVWSRKKLLALAGNQTLAVQLAALPYTDRAMPGLVNRGVVAELS
jgi:hypothetical protein